MTTPNFFIVGAPKCGTTALFEYLRYHPQVFIPEIKEPHYYCSDFPDYRRIRTREDYDALFAAATSDQSAVGDASVFYMYSQEAVPSLMAANEASKIIVMLRNPVDMVYSYHSQLVYSMREDVTDFADAWALQEQRRRGDAVPAHCRAPEHLQYSRVASLGSQLQRIYRFVPPSQVKTVVFDDLFRSPAAVYHETLKFLGLPDDGRRDFRIVNQNKVRRPVWLNSLLMRPPFPFDILKARMQRAMRLNTNRRVNRAVYRILSRRQVRPQMGAALRSELCEHFRGEVGMLQEILRRDLSHWLDPAGSVGRAGM